MKDLGKEWDDDRRLGAMIVIATAKRIGRLKWPLSNRERALVRAGYQAFEDGEDASERGMMPAGELGTVLSKALDRALRGLRDFPAAGQPTDEYDIFRFPFDGLPYTLFYRYNRAHGDIDVMAITRETHIHDLKTVEWLENNYPR